MSFPVDRRQAPDLNRADLIIEAPSFVQHGMAAEPTSISSLRESTHAESTSSLCDCLTSFANWIKNAFLSLFGISSNAQPEFSREWLAQKGEEYIDRQFEGEGLTFPLKAVAVIKFNDQVLAIPRSNVAASLSEFKQEVKGVFNQLLGTEDLSQLRHFLITTYLFNDMAPNAERVTHSISRESNHLNIPQHDPLFYQEMPGSSRDSTDMILLFLRDHFHPQLSREQLFETANFLLPHDQNMLNLARLMFGPRPAH